jgi:hypothetical protein
MSIATSLKPKFLCDEAGKQIAVQLTLREYEKLLDEIEDIEATRVYNRLMAQPRETIPAEQFFAEFWEERRKKNKPQTNGVSTHHSAQRQKKSGRTA